MEIVELINKILSDVDDSTVQSEALSLAIVILLGGNTSSQESFYMDFSRKYVEDTHNRSIMVY